MRKLFICSRLLCVAKRPASPPALKWTLTKPHVLAGLECEDTERGSASPALFEPVQRKQRNKTQPAQRTLLTEEWSVPLRIREE
jgi:hypothetical protein